MRLGFCSLARVDQHPEPARIHERDRRHVDNDVGVGGGAGAQPFSEEGH